MLTIQSHEAHAQAYAPSTDTNMLSLKLCETRRLSFSVMKQSRYSGMIPNSARLVFAMLIALRLCKVRFLTANRKQLDSSVLRRNPPMAGK